MNCKNCGAPLSNSMKCDYCGTNNSITEADRKDYIVKFEFDGAEREFYIMGVTYDTIELYSGRDIDGFLKTDRTIKRKITLVER